MKIYTKKGDRGFTSTYGGKEIAKSDISIEVLGSIDETNSVIGLATAKIQERDSDKFQDVSDKLTRIQHELIQLSSDIAADFSIKDHSKEIKRINKEDIKRLEEEIDEVSKKLPDLHSFILPGGSEISSLLHIARSTARRAERYLVRMYEKTKINPQTLVYLNRLSDWLFVYARFTSKVA